MTTESAGVDGAPEIRWVTVTGPEALQPLDRHWIRYVRLGLLFAAVLITWRILAWQEDGYRAAAAGADGAAVLQPLPPRVSVQVPTPAPELPQQPTVPIVVLPPTPTPSPAATPTPTPTPAPLVHQVRPGDTLSGIAQRYGVSMDAIAAINEIADRDNLLVSQELRLPADALRPAAGAEPDVYTVQPGDTLSTIAVAYGVNVDDLMTVNGLNDPDSIFVGQRLQIPARAA